MKNVIYLCVIYIQNNNNLFKCRVNTFNYLFAYFFITLLSYIRILDSKLEIKTLQTEETKQTLTTILLFVFL